MYQAVPTYNDPLPPSTSQYRHILTQYHQAPTAFTLYKSSSCNPQLSQLDNLPLIWWVTQSIHSLVHCCIVRLPSTIKQDSHILNTQLPLLGNVSRQPGSHRRSSLGLVTWSALACASGEQSVLHWCLLTLFFFSWDTTWTLMARF